MKCGERFIKFCGAIILGFVALSFALTETNNAVIHSELPLNSISCFPSDVSTQPNVWLISETAQTASPFLAYLFQILFILFIISPPIIALMLFLIWKELKARNKMK